MTEKYIKVFGTLEGQKLEYWLPPTEKELETQLTETESEAERIEREIETLQERKAQREAEALEEERIPQLERDKARCKLKARLIKVECDKLVKEKL